MTDPFLLFGGCYSNLEATEALFRFARDHAIPPDRIICTGDVVAYGADPVPTLDVVRNAGIRVVQGNCEEALGNRATDCGCGFSAGSICDGLATAWFAYADARMDDAARAWMRGLPKRLDIEIGGVRLAIVHGGIERNSEFVFASASDGQIAARIEASGADGVVGGHCGLPFTRLVGGGLWHNPGAIGMPANDGTPRAWFSLIEPAGERTLRIRHVSLDYDHGAAAGKMRAAGLPDGYAETLETGLWPSCDILPPPELAQRGRPIVAGEVTCRAGASAHWPASTSAPLPGKFSDPDRTATGEPRAQVALRALRTLWINTGTLCNLTCTDCYIESSPRNDRLAYISRAEARGAIAEALAGGALEEVGFTGGEPFMNPDILGMLEDALESGCRVLVLTNAMRPMQRLKPALSALRRRFPARLTIRVSLDHYKAEGHETLRGPRSWGPAIAGLRWLANEGFTIAVAGRTAWLESLAQLRAGYQSLFNDLGLPLDAENGEHLVLFPELDPKAEVPEISESCWGKLGKSPDDMMCATSRMVVKRRGAAAPAVVACTLIPYDEAFEMGSTVAEASRPVKLNHSHCARFCVLGGASCSPSKSTVHV